jgi:hypothetical protein
MATEWLPLLFFQPAADADPLVVAEDLLAGSASAPVVRFDAATVLKAVKATHGFGRLWVDLPHFSFDNERIDAGLEGTADPTQVLVRFFGDFDTLAESLFDALIGQGFVCYSVWDKKLLAAWPKWEELKPDKGFADRMSRILQRETMRLRETEPDPKRRARLLDAFVKGPQFRAEMAREARLEGPGRRGLSAPYSDYVNCFVRWKNGQPSASELAMVRKLDPRLAAMSIGELRNTIGDSPRLLLRTAIPPTQAGALREAAARHGLKLDVEPP